MFVSNLTHFVTAKNVAWHIKETVAESIKETGLQNDSYNAVTNFSNTTSPFSNKLFNNETRQAETLIGETTVEKKKRTDNKEKKRTKRKEEKYKAS